MVTDSLGFPAALFLLLALPPFTSYPLSLWLIRAWLRARTAPMSAKSEAREPSFAICLSAYNEEAVIERTVRNLLDVAETVRRCEILVYVDAATDSTATLLAPLSDRITLVVGRGRMGKSHGLNELVLRTSADVVVFTDANVELDRVALHYIGVCFAAPDVGCVCGNLINTNPAESATASTGSLYWRIEEAIKQLESDTFGVVGADGSLFAIRRALHQPVAPDVIDDFYLSVRILLGGHRVVREPR